MGSLIGSYVIYKDEKFNASLNVISLVYYKGCKGVNIGGLLGGISLVQENITVLVSLVGAVVGSS